MRKAGGDNHVRYALTAAVRGRVSKGGNLRPVPENLRIDGKICLVTGANTGLGKAVAVDLARRGARVLMACRSGHPHAGEEVRRLSGSGQVEMLRVDLADLDSVAHLCDELKSREHRIDIAVLNAGLVARRARRTPQGYEVMFAVNFLANRMLVGRLLDDGLIRPCIQGKEAPRIVFVASEAHRSAGPIDFERFGTFIDYGLRDSLKHYGLSKLHLCTYAQELSRRLNPAGENRVAVHSLCPGPGGHGHRAGSAGLSETGDLPADAPVLPEPGKGRQTRGPSLLRRAAGPAQRRIFACHAREAPVAAGDGRRRRGTALAGERSAPARTPARE